MQQVITTYGQCLTTNTIGLTTVPVQVSGLATPPLTTFPTGNSFTSRQGLQICNNSSTLLVYLGYNTSAGLGPNNFIMCVQPLATDTIAGNGQLNVWACSSGISTATFSEIG